MNPTQQLIKDINEIFDVNKLGEKRMPVDLGNDTALSQIPYNLCVNHFMVKAKNSNEYKFSKIQSLKSFITKTEGILRAWGINVFDRFCYVTVHQGYVKPNLSLRVEGWHTDALQGVEVPNKDKNDCEFVISNGLPTEFFTGSVDLGKIDLGKHNVFKRMEERVSGEIFTAKENRIFAMSSYHIHRSPINETDKDIFKKFIRVSFTKIPITSTKMTINENIEYGYATHTTNGEIPSHLI